MYYKGGFLKLGYPFLTDTTDTDTNGLPFLYKALALSVLY